MRLFGKKRDPNKKKKKGIEGNKEQKQYVICPHCFLDYTVEDVEKAGGTCPSCKGKIDLNKQPRAAL